MKLPVQLKKFKMETKNDCGCGKPKRPPVIIKP